MSGEYDLASEKDLLRIIAEQLTRIADLLERELEGDELNDEPELDDA